MEGNFLLRRDLRHLAYTGPANRTPTPPPASSRSSSIFDGSGSRDPDGGTLTYLWDFGTTSATLRARRPASATSNLAQVRGKPGNEATTPRIIASSASLLFRVGQEITLTGSATDPEDGALANDKLRWEVIRHHNNNRMHPFLQPPTGNNIKVTAPPPGDLFATDNGNYLEIRLTATDSNGASRTISRRLDPRRVSVTFKTSPKHKPNLTVNGATINAPKALVSWGTTRSACTPDAEDRTYRLQFRLLVRRRRRVVHHNDPGHRRDLHGHVQEVAASASSLGAAKGLAVHVIRAVRWWSSGAARFAI